MIFASRFTSFSIFQYLEMASAGVVEDVAVLAIVLWRWAPKDSGSLYFKLNPDSPKTPCPRCLFLPRLLFPLFLR